MNVVIKSQRPIEAYLDIETTGLSPRYNQISVVLYQAAGAEIKDLKMIEGGDHSFTDLDKLNEVIRFALDWFKLHV